jgi:hypothetical protein
VALIGNQTVLNKTPARSIGGNATSHASGVGNGSCLQYARHKQSDWRKFNGADQSGAGTFVATVKTAAKPTGYYPQGAWRLPTKAGEMACRIEGSGEASGTALLGKLMVAALTANGEASGTASLIINMIAALTGSGAVTGTAALRLNMLADLLGNGDLDGTMTGIANLTANLMGDGDIDATIMGIGYMYADITSAGDVLTAAAVAAAVWDEVLANHLTPGSTGAALNASGSAGDPWITTLPGAYTPTQAGGILYIIRQILKNKQKTDPATGIMTIYADDGTTVLLTANAFNDADGLIPYDGSAGINRRDDLA